MGYKSYIPGVLTGDTCVKDMEITWTKLGRDYLSGSKPNRVKGLTISYFTLSDSDMNYFVTKKNIKKFVPANSGVTEKCINGTNVYDLKWKIFKERITNVTDIRIAFRIPTSIFQRNTAAIRSYNNYINDLSYVSQNTLNDINVFYEPRINNDLIFINPFPYNSFHNLRNELGLAFLNTTNTITPTLENTLDEALITLKSILLSFINNIKPEYKDRLSNQTRFFVPIETKDISSVNSNFVNVGFTYNNSTNDLIFDDLDPLYRYKTLMLFFINNFLVTDLQFTDILGENTVTDNSAAINSNKTEYVGSLVTTLITNLRERPEPDTVNEINTGSFFIPGCFDLDCSDFTGIFASDLDVDIQTIANCIIADFDGWIQT